MRHLISIALLLALSGCADIGYYWHSARGHLSLMNQRVDIADLLADEQVGEQLQQRLGLVREIRQFSVDRLQLPDNDSYLNYVALDRPYVIQNLFAAREFSTSLHRWCYPIIGCAGYRGYYDEELLLSYIDELESDGLEVYVGRVSAYSTLGWFDDPVLSSFINWPEYRLAGLLFHELTHQQIYIDDDTTFNESLASAVQQTGTELWLKSRQQDDQLEEYSRWLQYRKQVIALIVSTRNRLSRIYAEQDSDEVKRQLKQQAFVNARSQHREIATAHGIKHGFTNWFSADLNNAKIGSIAAYNLRVSAFIQMIRAHNHDFAAFYDYVEDLGKFDKAKRERCLDEWSAGSGITQNCPQSGLVATVSG